MAWIFLLVAIAFEVIGTTFLKLSNGMENLRYAALMIVFYIASLTFVSFALKKIDVGVAYAIWSGVGIVCITAIGIAFFGEGADFKKLFFIGLIAAGAVGLRLSGTV